MGSCHRVRGEHGQNWDPPVPRWCLASWVIVHCSEGRHKNTFTDSFGFCLSNGIAYVCNTFGFETGMGSPIIWYHSYHPLIKIMCTRFRIPFGFSEWAEVGSSWWMEIIISRFIEPRWVPRIATLIHGERDLLRLYTNMGE